MEIVVQQLCVDVSVEDAGTIAVVTAAVVDYAVFLLIPLAYAIAVGTSDGVFIVGSNHTFSVL